MYALAFAETGCKVFLFVWSLLLLQEGTILAWKFNVAANCFEPAASLKGHTLAVVTLVVGGNRMYSGSMDHSIRVSWTLNKACSWFICEFLLEEFPNNDHQILYCLFFSLRFVVYVQVWSLETLQCMQTLSGHTDVVMSVLCWDQFLLSASLDKTVKVCSSSLNLMQHLVYYKIKYPRFFISHFV